MATNETPFVVAHEWDGIHVNQIEVGSRITLWLTTRVNGEVALLPDRTSQEASVPLREYIDPPTPAIRGDANRLRLVLDSVARYLSTGGTMAELAQALLDMRRIGIDGLKLGDWQLWDSYSTVSGDYEHFFVHKDTQEAVVWAEPTYNKSGGMIGGFIDRTTVEAYCEQNNDGAQEAGEAGEASEAGPPNPLQLPARTDPGEP